MYIQYQDIAHTPTCTCMYVHTHSHNYACTHYFCAYTFVHSHAHKLTPTQLELSWSYVEVHVLFPIGAGLGTPRNINIHLAMHSTRNE